jgi:hypothetical protein
MNLDWSTPLDQQFGERAVATAHIDPPLPRARRQPIEKYIAYPSTTLADFER